MLELFNYKLIHYNQINILLQMLRRHQRHHIILKITLIFSK